ncbi:MAG: hypothetical protein E6Q97_14695 [Desulfurellales bacterium]|nr:MAG: hypothetical protein E6Q97_14695 [Desulfurellales bacterium]
MTVTVADDSHNHVISNIDGLQAALDEKQNALGFTPVQQGGGAGQLSNKVHIGWDSSSNLLVQVDATNFGSNWPINISGAAAKLATARSIALAGDVSGSATFDGSSNISITATVIDDSHSHVISNVDGLQAALDAKAELATFQASTAINGYQKLPSGLIIQWGRLVVGDALGEHFGSISFPIAFPSQIFQVNATLYSYAGNRFDATIGVTNHSLTGFGFTIQEWGGVVQNLDVVYIAIGY